jgi:general secretion pathway protein L
MLKTLLNWWLQQLRSLLPAHWRNDAVHLPDALVVDCAATGGVATGAELLHRHRRKERRIGRLGTNPTLGRIVLPSTRRCVLRLAGSPLQRDIVLPAAVEAHIPNILTNDMGRLAPFSAAEIFWNWRIVQRDEARKRLTVQFWYVPRRALQPLLEALGGFHVVPAELEVVGPTGQVLRLSLQEPSRNRNTPRWVPVAAALVLLAGVAVPFAMQSAKLSALDQQLSAVEPRAQRAERLRERLTFREPGPAARAAEVRRVGDVLEVLAAVTDALPDDTVLADLTFRERKITITGSSAEAALLIAALSSFPLIRDPAFAAPIVHDPASSRDSFSLHADIAP